MIIGGSKAQVVKNISNAVKRGEFYSKVEVIDPNLTLDQKENIINKHFNDLNKLSYKLKNWVARSTTSVIDSYLNKDTIVVGKENIKNIKSGAIITCNHFNPIDNTIIREFTKKVSKKRLYIISEETNFAMQGFLGFLVKYNDIIPLTKKLDYIKCGFSETIENVLSKNNFLLIYPEQEMWFNYRKPRPPKSGAYYYAIKNNVPIISCFIEMINTNEKDNDEFYKVKHVLHILSPIYPDKNKSLKQNKEEMMKKDYEQKKSAYETAYNKKLTYEFEIDDIAGWI